MIRLNSSHISMSGITQVRYESLARHIFFNEAILSSISQSECKFLSLATETLDGVCWVAEQATILNLGLVCKRMHSIAARVLYHGPTLDDQSVHPFLSVISSSPKNSLDYGSLIKSLTLRLVENRAVDIYPLLCQAFAQMTGLISLTLRTYLWPTYLRWTSVNFSEIQWSSVKFSGVPQCGRVNQKIQKKYQKIPHYLRFPNLVESCD